MSGSIIESGSAKIASSISESMSSSNSDQIYCDTCQGCADVQHCIYYVYLAPFSYHRWRGTYGINVDFPGATVLLRQDVGRIYGSAATCIIASAKNMGGGLNGLSGVQMDLWLEVFNYNKYLHALIYCDYYDFYGTHWTDIEVFGYTAASNSLPRTVQLQNAYWCTACREADSYEDPSTGRTASSWPKV